MYSKKKAEFTPLYISLTSTLKKLLLLILILYKKKKL